MPIAPDIPAAETAIVEMTNSFRAQHKLGAVKPNAALAAAARAYAKVLGKSGNKLSHTIDGTTPVSRAKAAGYAHCQIAENLAAIYDSGGFTGSEYARRAMQGWENSPGHRQNLLMPNVTETGVAVVRAGPNDPRYIAVQLFARPLKLKYSFKIANRSRATVDYTFAGESYDVSPRQTITHASCAPGTLTFAVSSGPAHYAARDGQVFTLAPGANGGVSIDVKGGVVSP
jgi:Cysteine-rich secretory protein family